MKKLVVIACSLSCIATSGSLRSQDLQPLGSEFQINTITTGSQQYPAVAGSGSGSFLLLWESTTSLGTDDDSFSIQARRYTAAGSPIGTEFQVNTYTTSLQRRPRASGSGDGDFVIVWDSTGSYGNDSNYSIQARRLDSSGAFVGNQFQVNTFTFNDQKGATVAVAPDGDFLVAWTSRGSLGGDTDENSIAARLYNANGVPVGLQFQVNTYTTSFQTDVSVASDAAGNFIVTWASFASSGSDSDGASIQAQRLDSTGMFVGSEFQVNTYTTDSQRLPEVASDPEGNFIVAWQTPTVRAQVFNADGNRLGAEFETTSPSYKPSAGADGQGRFIVSWFSGDFADPDDEYGSIKARLFQADGTAVGNRFQVNSYTTNRQWRTSVAGNPQGDFVVVWQSYGSFGSDSDVYSVQGQRFGFPVFAGAFENGDFTGWDEVEPPPGP